MINGKRVTMRPLEDGDLEYVQSLNEEPTVRNNVVGWAFPNSLSEQRSWFAASAGNQATRRWLVLDEHGEPLGLTGLWDVDWHNRNALTALKIGGREDLRGKGYGVDAIKAVMAFAFYDVGLQRLYGSILAGNDASMRAYCEKSGWSVEGVSRRHVWRHGDFVDLVQVAVLRADFDALPDAQDYIALVTGGSH